MAEYLTDPALKDLPHGFFTRRGGVSAGPFASLNCSLSGRDEVDAVMENRTRAAAALGLPLAALTGLHQVHGAGAVPVERPWPDSARPQADAMVTDRAGVGLAIVTADCAPVLFADASAGVIGAAHAGWRGALSGIIESTVAAMEQMGARRGAITAVIGPSIRQLSYEVDDAFRAQWLAADPAHARWFAAGRRPSHHQFDLAGAVADAAHASGCGTVAVVAADTAAEPERFFSFRRNSLSGGGPIGHQVSIIALEKA
jgi:YfiH family protein